MRSQESVFERTPQQPLDAAIEFSRLQDVRVKIHQLEQKRTDTLFKKKAIGRVTTNQSEVDYVSLMKLNRQVKFRWQRTTKIGRQHQSMESLCV